MKRYLIAFVSGMMAILLGAPDVSASTTVTMRQGMTVLGALRSKNCSRARLAETLALNNLTMVSARRIRKNSELTLPDVCTEQPSDEARRASIQLILDEHRGAETDPKTLLQSIKEQDQSSSQLEEQVKNLNDANVALQAKITELETANRDLQSRTAPQAFGYSLLSLILSGALALCLGIGLGIIAPRYAQSKEMRTATSIPSSITVKDEKGNSNRAMVKSYQPDTDKLTLVCPRCGHDLVTTPRTARAELALHFQSFDHPGLMVSSSIKEPQSA